MSQHYLFIENTNQVLMFGWDKPVQEAYLIFGQLNSKADDWEYPLIIDMVNPFDRVNNIKHVDEIVFKFNDALSNFDVELTENECKALIQDIQNNSVNEMWLHTSNNPPEQLEDTPFNTELFKSKREII